MPNPYRENQDKIQAFVRQLSKEHQFTTPFETQYQGSNAYAENYVVVSGAEPFDSALTEGIKDLMKEATDGPDSTTM